MVSPTFDRATDNGAIVGGVAATRVPVPPNMINLTLLSHPLTGFAEERVGRRLAGPLALELSTDAGDLGFEAFDALLKLGNAEQCEIFTDEFGERPSTRSTNRIGFFLGHGRTSYARRLRPGI